MTKSSLPPAVKKTTSSSPIVPKPPTSLSNTTLLRKKQLICTTPDKSRASAAKLKSAKLPPQVPRINCSPVPMRKFMLKDLCSPINAADSTKNVMLTAGIAEREDCMCNPYELESNLLYSRKIEVKKKLHSTLSQIERIDLRKGSFSSKQIMSAGNSLNNSNHSHSKAKILPCLENTLTEEGSGSFMQNSSTRTPSPSMSTSRTSKLSLLSRKFKIDKHSFVENLQKQTRRSQSTNIAAQDSLSETLPFQNFLKDLEFVSNITETRPLPAEASRRNLSLKLKRL